MTTGGLGTSTLGTAPLGGSTTSSSGGNMVYAPYTWVDGAAGGTPISAASLNHLEGGVGDASAGSADPTSHQFSSAVRNQLAADLGDPAQVEGAAVAAAAVKASGRASLPVVSALASRSLIVARPAVKPAPPTVVLTETGNSSMTPFQSMNGLATSAVRLIGSVPFYDFGTFSVPSHGAARGTYGVEMDAYLSTLDLFYRAVSGAGYYWVWVDDQPCTATPVAWTATVNATERLTITFPGVEAHRIKVYTDLLDYKEARLGVSDSVTAAPRKPVRFMAVGDSLTEGSGETIPQRTWLQETARQLDWEPAMNAIGGTGYVQGTKPFTDPDRLTAMQDPSIDFYHFKGSVNDNADAPAAIQAAAEKCYQTIYDANPNALILVSGPDSTNATSVVPNYSNTNAVRAAALNFAGKNVIGFVDPLRTKGLIGPWSGGTAYNTGDRVSYNGGVYEAIKPTSATAFTTYDWLLITVLYGTGYQTAPKGDGNRDQFILNDNVHWSLEAHRVWGGWFANQYRAALDAYTRGVFYLDE